MPDREYGLPMTAVPGIAPLLPGVAPSAAPTATVPALENTATEPAPAGEEGTDAGGFGRWRAPPAAWRWVSAFPLSGCDASRVEGKGEAIRA